MPIHTVERVDTTGQNIAELGAQAGVSGADIATEQARTEGQGVTPDAAIGNILSNREPEPPPAFVEPPTEPPPITSTSTEAREDDAATGDAVTETSDGLSDTAEGAFDTAFGILDDIAAANKQDKADAVANMTEQGRIAGEELSDDQRVEAGRSSSRLARMGGYLGGSGSGLAYMNSLSRSHRLEAASLKVKYAQAVEAAKRAYNSDQLATAQAMMNSANQYQNQLNAQRELAMKESLTANELLEFERETDNLTMDAWAAQGYSVDDIPPAMFSAMDKKNGYETGTSRGLYEISVLDRGVKTAEDEIRLQESIIDMTTKLKPNQSFTVNGITYHGSMAESKYLGYQVDKKTGDVAILEQDTATGKASFSIQKGILTPNVEYEITDFGDGLQWYVPTDPNDGEAIPVLKPDAGAGVNTQTLFDSFPSGVKPAGTNNGWCLEFGYMLDENIPKSVNGKSMDLLETKREWTDEAITVDNVTAGSWMITNEDSKWGHIALVREVTVNEKGEKIAILSESNGPGSAGKVNHVRTMVLSKDNTEENGGKIVGFHKANLKPEYTSQNHVQVESEEDLLNLAPEDRRTLLGVGFSASEIGSIESDVSTYGIDAVLEGISDVKQKEAVRDAYNATSKTTVEDFKLNLTDSFSRSMELGLTRKETEKAINIKLEEKYDKIPKVIKNMVRDSLDEVYGKPWYR